MIRLIPPTAISSNSGQIAAAWFSAGEENLGRALARVCGTRHAAFFPSGRAALSATLECWKRSPRDEVVIPAYTCWSVAASIVRAGLRIRLVDVDPLTLDYRVDRLAESVGERTLAVLAAHLFARTADTSAVADAAESSGARWIDDAAQALPSGPTAADATILSFGRGKPLALGGGGAALASGDWLRERPLGGGGVGRAATLGLTALLARPMWYRLPQALPFLGIGTTTYNPDFAIETPFYRWQERLGARLFDGHGELSNRRANHARALIDAIDACPGWSVAARDLVARGPLRLPVLAPDLAARRRISRGLHRLGVAASAMYPGTIASIEGIDAHLARPGTYPGAEQLVDRLLTLPTYPTLSSGDLKRIVDAFVSLAGEGR